MHTSTSRVSTPLPVSSNRDSTFPMDDELDDGEMVLPADSPGGAADLEERVQSTQTRLAQLRQEADALEQEKKRFEELSRQQKEFMQGRAEMGDKLTKALNHLDRETYEAQRKVEQLLGIKETLNHQLDVIDSLNPEQWNPADLRHDLTRALAMIQEAREEYLIGSAKVHQLSAVAAHSGAPGGTGSGTAPAATLAAANRTLVPAASAALTAALPQSMNRETFRFWMFCGLGFTAPLALTALVLFLAWLLFR